MEDFSKSVEIFRRSFCRGLVVPVEMFYSLYVGLVHGDETRVDSYTDGGEMKIVEQHRKMIMLGKGRIELRHFNFHHLGAIINFVGEAKLTRPRAGWKFSWSVRVEASIRFVSLRFPVEPFDVASGSWVCGCCGSPNQSSRFSENSARSMHSFKCRLSTVKWKSR